MDLSISVSGDDALRVVRLEGGCDLAGVPALREALMPMAPPEVTELVIDASQLAMLDDTGLGVLLGALRRQREGGGEMKVAGARGTVLDAIRTIGLDRVIPLFDDVPTATSEGASGLS